MNLLSRVCAYRHFTDIDLLERAYAALIVVGSRNVSLLIRDSTAYVRESLLNRLNNVDDLPMERELESLALEPVPAKPIKRSRLGRGLSALLSDAKVESGLD